MTHPSRTAAVAHALKLQYEQRSVHKTYFAVVHGNMSEAVTVDQPLGKVRPPQIAV